MFRATGGNPFFVTELLATPEAQHSDAVPARVRDAMLARIARLSPAAKRVLCAAAILGPSTSYTLTEVASEPAAAVDECATRGLLLSVATNGANVYDFRHELTRRAVQDVTPAETAAELHASAVRWLLTQPVDHRRLAHHAAACGDAPSCSNTHRRLRARAARMGAHREAAELFELTLRHGGALHGTGRASVLSEYATELTLIDRIAEALEARREALSLYEAADDDDASGHELRFMAVLSEMLGQAQLAADYAGRSIAVLERLPPSANLAFAYGTLAYLLSYLGRAEESVALCDRALAQTSDPEANAFLLAVKGGTIAYIDGEQAEQLLLQSLEISEQHNWIQRASSAYSSLTSTTLTDGRIAKAAVYAERTLNHCALHGMIHQEAVAMTCYGIAQAELGEFDKSDPELGCRLRQSEPCPVAHPAGKGVEGFDRSSPRRGTRTPARRGEASARRRAKRLAGLGRSRALKPRRPGSPETSTACRRSSSTLYATRRSRGSEARSTCGLAAGNQPERPWRSTTPALPAPSTLALRGQHRAAAADAFAELSLPLWRAYVLGQSESAEDAQEALLIAESIGAHAARAAILRDRRRLGLSLPRLLQTGSGRLTRRQQDVLQAGGRRPHKWTDRRRATPVGTDC